MNEFKLLVNKKLTDLAWPEGLNLDLLFQLLGEGLLRALIDDLSEKGRRERRIILPSKQTIRKVICYHLGEMVERGEASWDDIKTLIQEELGALKELGVKLQEVKRLHAQRKKELEEEKKKAEQRAGYLAHERMLAGAGHCYIDLFKKKR